jgi:CubicO group peptidase (beta-lactamase class C family)
LLLKRITPALIAALLILAGSAGADTALKRLDNDDTSVAAMEDNIRAIMEKGGVTGLSCAIINDSKIVYRKTFGLKTAKSEAPADEETIFAGASFSKTVFAYLVMQLVADGRIDLDRPLVKYLEKPLPEYENYSDLEGDDRYKNITTRMCLTHTTGFPNWRFFTEDNRLQFLYDPGERHSYSGEGIELLQFVVEEVMGTGLADLAQEKVFGPLNMRRTSYVWQDNWEANVSGPHDIYKRSKILNPRRDAEAAGSMFTTADDYAKMLVAILSAEGEQKILMDEMIRTQIAIEYAQMFGPGARERSDEYEKIKLGWSLGWGRFDCQHGRAIFHTGHETGWQNYTVTFVDAGIGVVLLGNSDNFESVARELVAVTIGDTVSPFDWLGYPRYDPNRDWEPPPEPVAVRVDSEILKLYAGRYSLSPDKTVFVEFRDGGLVVSTDEVAWVSMIPLAENRFFIEAEGYRLEFVSVNGEVGYLNLEIGGAVIRAERLP